MSKENTNVNPEGFRLGDDGVSIALGDEKDILESLRQNGFSEEAISAFKSGKPIIMNFHHTPFGIYREETWRGKDEEQPPTSA